MNEATDGTPSRFRPGEGFGGRVLGRTVRDRGSSGRDDSAIATGGCDGGRRREVRVRAIPAGDWRGNGRRMRGPVHGGRCQKLGFMLPIVFCRQRNCKHALIVMVQPEEPMILHLEETEGGEHDRQKGRERA